MISLVSEFALWGLLASLIFAELAAAYSVYTQMNGKTGMGLSWGVREINEV